MRQDTTIRTSPIAEDAPVMTTTLPSMSSLVRVLSTHSTPRRNDSVGHANASITMLAGGTTRSITVFTTCSIVAPIRSSLF